MKSYEDTENKIIGTLLRMPLERRSLLQIAVDTKLSYVTVHKLIPFLVRKKLITLEKKGKASLVSIDFEHAKLEKLSSAALYEKNILLKKYRQLAFLVKEIEEGLSGKFYSLILFGSYAKEKSKKQSDIDLLFIVPKREDIEIYKEKINKSLKVYPTIKKDVKLASTADFMDMLDQKYTVGREAFQSGLVLFGIEHYYAMVKTYVRTRGY